METKELNIFTREQHFKNIVQEVLDSIEKLNIAGDLLMELGLKLCGKGSGCSEKTHACGIIYQTTDYEMFKILKGNREINKTNEKNLAKNMGENGEDYIMNPIIVNEKMEIIDGQHRFNVLKKIGKPIHFIIIDGADGDTAQRMNQVSLRWSLLNFINYHKEVSPDYERLYKLVKEFCEEPGRNNGLSVTTIYAIVLGRPASSSNQAIKDAITKKSFEFSEADFDKIRSNLKTLLEFKQNYGYLRGHKHSDKLFNAIYYLMFEKGCSQERFRKGLYMLDNNGKDDPITKKKIKVKKVIVKTKNFEECLNTAYRIYCTCPGNKKKLDMKAVNEECHPVNRQKSKAKA